MSRPLEDYALIGDTRTAALVGLDGAIDWMCVPRFDSGACFAALLGDSEHGRWSIHPDEEVLSVERAYQGDTLVVDTTMHTVAGAIRITDLMVPEADHPTVIRQVTGLSGRVSVTTELRLRFDYGSIVPWVSQIDGRLHAIAGPDAVVVDASVPLVGRNMHTQATFDVSDGEAVSFVFVHHPSHEPMPGRIDADEAITSVVDWWTAWMQGCTASGPYVGAMRRSAITLKALTFGPTGGIVAAPTTSLPEEIGGERNWDYRLCWLRDATFTLYALLVNGFHDEATQWRRWLLRAAAGRPEDLQVLYGVAGERRIPEQSVDWLPGYGDSRPVRVGNAARGQFQLDVYGEVLDVLHLTRRFDGAHPESDDAWSLQLEILKHLEQIWDQPDSSLWEVRGPLKHFTHSKVMAWVGFDRAVKAVERYGRDGPVDHWRRIRGEIQAEVCEQGFNSAQNTFVQAYGHTSVDAALLMLPLVGFIPADDLRMLGTVEAIERTLMRDGLVVRYIPDPHLEGLPGEEGAFLPCSFWLADNYALQGRTDEARQLFERLLGLCNDVGLLSEEYDTTGGRMVGNFPQAFTHVALINTAHNLTSVAGPALHRSSAASADVTG